MELRNKSDDRKIITALVCLFAGLAIIWNIAAQTADIYELRLDAETCQRVRMFGLAPSDNCAITAPFRPLGLVPGGFLILPDGSEMQIAPVAASQTGHSAEWSAAMKAQLWIALLFWAAALALLFGVFRGSR